MNKINFWVFLIQLDSKIRYLAHTQIIQKLNEKDNVLSVVRAIKVMDRKKRKMFFHNLVLDYRASDNVCVGVNYIKSYGFSEKRLY